MQQLLMIEDDTRLAHMVGEYLERSGFGVTHAPDARAGLHLLEEPPSGATPDLVVLDLTLPGHDGFEIVGNLRRRGNKVPVLMLTARDGVEDRVKGLELGADDYLVKPFHLTEVRARVRALLRRSQGEASNQITVGRLALDVAQRRAWFAGAEVRLSGREFAVLEFLALNAGGYYTRDRLLEHVWPGDTGVDPRTVDTYIRYLRRKLGDDAILTVRNLGYRFRG